MALDTYLHMKDSVARADSIALQSRLLMRADVNDSLVQSDSGFNIYGLSVFRSSTSQFDASTSGPVDANYRLGAGDGLVLILTGDIEASYELDVTREGFVDPTSISNKC